MILFVSATTNCPDLFIDYIEVKLKTGECVSLNWDESDIDRDGDSYETRYKAVSFGDKYANGRLAELDEMKVVGIQMFSETMDKVDLVIHEMMFEDDCDTMIFREPFSIFGGEANG